MDKRLQASDESSGWINGSGHDLAMSRRYEVSAKRQPLIEHANIDVAAALRRVKNEGCYVEFADE